MGSVAATFSRKLTAALDEAQPVSGREAEGASEVAAEEASEPIVHARSTEERVAVLETRYEGVATKADLTNVKADLVRWTIGAGATILIGVLGLLFTLHNSTASRIDSVNERLDTMQSDVNSRLDQVNTRLDTMQSDVNSRFDAMQRDINVRFDQVNARLDSAVAELRAENREINQRLDRVIEMLAAQSASRAQ